jgi:hypothetical protein
MQGEAGGEGEEVRETGEVLGPRRAVSLQVGPEREVSSMPGARSPSTACRTAFVEPGRRSMVRQGRWRRRAAGAGGDRTDVLCQIIMVEECDPVKIKTNCFSDLRQKLHFNNIH